MTIIVATGEDFEKSEVLYSTEKGTIAVGYTITVEIMENTFIAVIPLSDINSLEIEYVEETEAESNQGLSVHE